MKKFEKKISLLLTLILLLISTTQITQANTIGLNKADAVKLGQKIPLTNSQIQTVWPNLPTAQELYKEGCIVIDLRYCGKQASSMKDNLPEPNSPTIIDIESMIVNCTVDIPDYLHGGIIRNYPKIWLQYNSSIWISVPYKYLKTDTQPTQRQQANTWAIGMFNNPTDIAGSYEVWGACTFGQFPANSFGSGDSYLGTDVLSISSSTRYYQLVTQLSPNGKDLVYNIFNRATGALIDIDSCSVSGAATGQLYNQYIKYSNSGGGRWEMWWNQTLYWYFTGDTGTRMLKGFQPNVVVESNDFNEQHYQGFSTTIGGRYYYQGVNYPLAATCFLFNGNWVPSLPGQYAPAGRAYLGGTQLGTWGAVGTYPPPTNWDSDIGMTSSAREIFTVGVGLSRPSHGDFLWTYGQV